MSSIQPCPGLNDVDYYMVGISKLPGFDRVVKLSSNESALGPSPLAVAAASQAMAEAHRYPEVETEQLRDALAAHFDLQAARITFGPGSDELLTRLVNTFAGPGDEVIHSAHAYMQFPIYAKTAGATPVAADDENFRHSVDGLLNCVSKRTKIVIVANPDNPSGTHLSDVEIRRLRKALPTGVLLIVDAAYDEYAWADDYRSATAMVEERDDVVVTRTFSKVFGLAGLRLGWCYGTPDIVDILERIGPSFPVNLAARQAGLAALADRDHTRAVLRHNTSVGQKFSQDLTDLGLEVFPSQTNFVLVRFPDQKIKTAAAANRFLLDRGIIARQFAVADFEDKLRFTIGLEDEMEAAYSALGDFMNA
ncbi:MAG: histidinol-phosphate transaminase [Pseudomonadota bacterium]